MSGAVQRLAELLQVSGKTRGFKKPVYRKEGAAKVLDHYARQHIEVIAEDILEVCAAAADQADPVVQAQTQGCSGHVPGQKVILLADDVFHLVELATPPPAAPVEPAVEAPVEDPSPVQTSAPAP